MFEWFWALLFSYYFFIYISTQHIFSDISYKIYTTVVGLWVHFQGHYLRMAWYPSGATIVGLFRCYAAEEFLELIWRNGRGCGVRWRSGRQWREDAGGRRRSGWRQWPESTRAESCAVGHDKRPSQWWQLVLGLVKKKGWCSRSWQKTYAVGCVEKNENEIPLLPLMPPRSSATTDSEVTSSILIGV